MTRSLVGAGWEVLGIGRRKERLLDLANELGCRQFLRVAADLTADDGPVAVSAALAKAGWDTVDAAVFCAGHGRGYGPFRDAEIDRIVDEIETNLSATVRLARSTIERTDRAEGTMIFIGSVFATTPHGDYAAYSASKAGLLQFVRSLRAERTESAKTRLCVISPGTVRTEFASLTVGRPPAVYPANLWSYPPLEPEYIARTVEWVLSLPGEVEVREILISPRGEPI